MEAGNQPPQPPLGEAQSKGQQPQLRRQLRSSQPSLVEAHQLKGQEPQPRKRKGKETPAVAKKPRREYSPQGQNTPAASKQPCDRSRSRTPAELIPEEAIGASSHQDSWYNPSNIAPYLHIRGRSPPLRRSWTAPIPPTFVNHLTSRQNTVRYFEHQQATNLRKQRSKLHRANLKAQRDFPHTLESLAHCGGHSNSESEYTPSSLADSNPTSGQSTPESLPEPISNEDLFGLRARPISPVPPTPTTPPSPTDTWALSSSSGSNRASSSNSSSDEESSSSL